MYPGLMQTTPLQISSILKFAATAHARRPIVSSYPDGEVWRYDYAGLQDRCRELCRALPDLGVSAGDRVSSLAWNTHRHLELFYGITGMGAVLHTANPRLNDEQLIYTIKHAQSKILFFDASLRSRIKAIASRLDPELKLVVLAAHSEFPEAVMPGLIAYDELLLSKRGNASDWPVFDENSAAFLCYTSGTTGNPKGVLYSHRAVVLHAMGASMLGAFGFSPFDVVMPCSSLYHATAWGLPFSAPLCGAKLVLPGQAFDGASLHRLMEAEGVTFTGGVPTIWTDYLTWLRKEGTRPASTLKRVVIAGSAVPRAMAEEFGNVHGIEVLQLWGMTETCPLGVVATPTPALAEKGEIAMREVIWTKQGRLQFGIELKIVDEDGKELPWDGETAGTLMVRGPWTIKRYFRETEDSAGEDGWFDTGDVATIDEDGFMRITDRIKDVIKSGGEWVSSIDLENAAVAYPGVRVAAAVGVRHPRWEERPILVLEADAGAVIEAADVVTYLESKVAKWWLPDRIIFEDVPLNANGKIDKQSIKRKYFNILDE